MLLALALTVRITYGVWEIWEIFLGGWEALHVEQGA